jgi:Asp-tRNA(Asn)/Glu-tRNA(Gln) amidotransferase A subunit family amidase
MDSPNLLAASAAAEAIRNGTLTSEALTRACLERIEAREADVLAWAHMDPEQALAEARARDREPPRGPLHGVPVGFKDIIDTADMPTRYGSAIYPDHRPAADAACVTLIRAAGGIVLGKTVTTEFAFRTPNKTHNPHNLDHTPGGSSSGSAAGVADYMVPLAFGTQTGGSIIRPASFCGVVGYKPSFGQFSYVGVKLLAQSLDTLGGFARTVGDLALLRQAMLGAPAAVAARIDAPKLGLCLTPWWEAADASTQVALEMAGAALAKVGAEVREVALPETFDPLPTFNDVIMVFEGRRSLAHEFSHHEALLSAMLKEAIPPEAGVPFEDYRAALKGAWRCRAQLAEVMHGLDALLVPSAVGEAPLSLDSTGNALFNKPWTTIGAPCITLPKYMGPTDLPVGVQLVGRPGDDEALLSVAAWAETALASA